MAEEQELEGFLGDQSALVGELRAFAISETNAEALARLYRAGWVPADGRSLPQQRYPELFRAIGTTWGRAQDQASFLVPDLRGVFLRGYAGQSNRDPDAAARIESARGSATGNSVGSYQQDGFQAHRHADAGHHHELDQQQWTNKSGAPGPYDQSVGGGALTSKDAKANITDPTPSDPANPPRTSSETRPRNVAVYYFIYAGRPFGH